MRTWLSLSGLCVLSLATATACAENIYLNGKVTDVGDGDTITLAVSGNPPTVEVRFAGIDAPEKPWPGHWGPQPFYMEATEYVKNAIKEKEVTVLLTGDQTYGRVVGEVFYQGRSINRELVREGLAWWNKKYAQGDFDLRDLQKAAQSSSNPAERKGLWKRDDSRYTLDLPFAPPWEWRHQGLGD